ncbi:Protein kinase, putative [Hondaea fermentalgiana]|uniref:Protein kinase, putative n=1 Tax=Hondaea fermentalgiana TaxID=2315210 RepID=A0A2R5G3Z4_9STRA|nr:Protein kinase, putative [Hondaea fermentalgiana]|eukprot:GBG24498.1 Protein kinase, putative [Hondaea fermentalgiana]
MRRSWLPAWQRRSVKVQREAQRKQAEREERQRRERQDEADAEHGAKIHEQHPSENDDENDENDAANVPHRRREAGAAREHEAEARTEGTVASSNKPRTIYDDYSIRSEVGKGGYSRVYRAVQRSTGNTVAIKVMAVEDFDLEMHDIVENEIYIMERICEDMPELDSSFVQIIEVVRERERICIVMEFLEGGELFDRIVQRKHYTERDARTIMSRVTRTVRALHAQGIIHRDLKPENLVFQTKDDSANLKLMDFGLALELGSRDPHRSLEYVGTLGYVAPEILICKEYEPACDVFSLGVILFILLVGRQPFRGRNAAEQINATKTGAFSLHGPHWDSVSDSAKDLVERMLDVDPSTRITLDEAVRHPWMYTSSISAATRQLAGTLVDLRKFNDRRKIGVVAQHIMSQTTDDMRLALMGLLENTAHASGLTAKELMRILRALQPMRWRGSLTRDEFVSLMRGVGLGSLPAGEIFDVLLARSGTTNVGGRVYSATALRREPDTNDAQVSETQQTLDPDDDASHSPFEEAMAEPMVQIDEIVVGLSVIAVKGARERVLQSVFNFMADGRDASPGSLSAKGYAKVLRLIASYESINSRQAKNMLASDLATVFSDEARTPSRDNIDPEVAAGASSADHDADSMGEITFEDFRRGVLSIGNDVLTSFFTWRGLVRTVKSLDPLATRSGQASVKRITSYWTRITSMTRDNPAALADARRHGDVDVDHAASDDDDDPDEEDRN